MAKTLLNGVNEILKRSQIIAGDAGLLTTLTDSARQVSIDCALQVINEGIDELYSTSGMALPIQQVESTFTLVNGTRAYTLATGWRNLRWPLIDKTNRQFIKEYTPGYNHLLQVDLSQTWTGLPEYGVIRPTDGKLYLDRTPTSVEDGRVYTYQYDKDMALTAASDAMPFDDDVFRAMVPAWVQLFKRERRNEFDGPLFQQSMGRASRLLTNVAPRTSYLPR